jgi:hypothetical protein
LGHEGASSTPTFSEECMLSPDMVVSIIEGG